MGAREPYVDVTVERKGTAMRKLIVCFVAILLLALGVWQLYATLPDFWLGFIAATLLAIPFGMAFTWGAYRVGHRKARTEAVAHAQVQGSAQQPPYYGAPPPTTVVLASPWGAGYPTHPDGPSAPAVPAPMRREHIVVGE